MRRYRAWYLLAALIAGMVAAAWYNHTPSSAPAMDGNPWFYLRHGTPLAPDESPAELILLGDISLGRETDGGYLPAPPTALAAVAPWLRAADLVLGNLESVLVPAESEPAVPPGAYLLRGEPEAALALATAGIDLVSVVNNHAWDYGPEGFSTSNASLRRWGVAQVYDVPAVRELRGLRVAFLAFNQVRPAGPSSSPLPTQEEMSAAVTAAATETDLVVVAVHWGYEYELRPDPAQERLAGALLAAGADIVGGHHPHVAQPVALLNGGLVAYSLGNFLFDQNEDETAWGLALRVLVDEAGVRAVQGLPVSAGPRPDFISPDAAESFLARISPPPRRMGFAVEGKEIRPVAVPQDVAAGRFSSGRTDLTGDGREEQVRLEGTRVRVYSGGLQVWESPPAWEVADVALGDPNDDGRQELMLAVWKADPAEHRRSHPFLVGYRGGAYNLIWGGRAVSDPIEELALGDVDGDGREELLVLVAPAGGRERAVAVWRWHGWGFSLFWQSAPGPFRDLVVLPGTGEKGAIISVVRTSAGG